jgi:hypothetical protein
MDLSVNLYHYIEDKRYIAQSDTQCERLTSLSLEISRCRISNNCSVRVCSNEGGRFSGATNNTNVRKAMEDF